MWGELHVSRPGVNEERRSHYWQQNDKENCEQVETVALAVAEEPALSYANLYIWREKRKDAPIHGIAAAVFQNGAKVLEVEPIHCSGYRRRDLERYVQKEVMGYLNARFGITFFAEEIRLEPIECSIPGCPYAERLAPSAEVVHE